MHFLLLFVLVLQFLSPLHAQPHATNTTENQHNPSLQRCWLHAPMPPECNDNTTLGGNIAFPAMFSIPILREADSLTSKFAAFQPSEWKSSNEALSYHVSIDYMFCVPKQYTDLVHVGMRTLEWNSMSLTTSHACCEPGHLQLCLDDESSLKMAAFAQHVRTHLRSLGIPVPDYTSYQPPFHISLGSTSLNYNWTAALSEIDHSTSITFQVDALYFGSHVYRADDWLWSIAKSGGSAQFLFIVFVILLMLGIILYTFGKYLIQRCRNSNKSITQTNNDNMTTVTVPMNSIIVLPYNASTNMASSTTATGSDLLYPLLATTSTSTSPSTSLPLSPSLSLLSDEHPTPDPPHPALHLEELFSPTHIQFHLDTERSREGSAYLFSPSQLHIHH